MIHASGISVWQQCKRLWWLTDKDMGLGYRSAYPNEALTVGDWMHQALKTHYNNRAVPLDVATQQVIGDWFDNLPEHLLDNADEYRSWATLTRAMALAYQAYWLKGGGVDHLLPDARFKPYFLEEPWEYELNGYKFEGIWDGIFIDRETEDLWVWEHKTTSNPGSLLQGIHKDWQPRLYLIAARGLLDKPVRGIIYNVLKRTNPYQVKILKSSLPSKAQNELASTTYDAYLCTLAQCAEGKGELLEDLVHKYEDQLDQLRLAPNEIFLREQVVFPDHVLERNERELSAIAEHMTNDASQGGHVPPSYNRFTCVGYNPCLMWHVCSTMDDGIDPILLLDAQFVKETQ